MTNKWLKVGLSVFAFILLGCWLMASEAQARAGGGRSSGSRGSRSFSAPKAPSAPQTTQPSRPSASPTTPAPGAAARPTPPPAQPTSSFWRSFGGGVLGGLAGGLLFRSLFGGPAAHAAPGAGGGFGVGLLDILILAGIGYMIYVFIKRRRQEAALAEGPALQSSGEQLDYRPGSQQPAYYEMQPEVDKDLEEGLRQIKQMDLAFDETRFPDQVMDFFFRVQGAWANRDMSPMKQDLTEEMHRILQEDADRLKAEGRINRLENIAVRSVDITEAWQESGQDYITVRVFANLLDYMVDDKTGEVVAGSRTEPVKFEEYWTFTRPIGTHLWQLAAINQPQ
jgi:predicted lipid-binding transport protein (Tim44 family)